MFDQWLAIDWASMFIPSKSPIEMFVRGTVIYFLLFTLLRFSNKRQLGGIGLSDLLLVLLLAEAVNNAMAGEYKSITDGALLVVTLIFWNYTMDWMDYRFPAIHRILQPPPLPLIRNGRLMHDNMRREFITEDELVSQLRLQGINDIRKVREAYMEPDGRVSTVTENGQPHEAPEPAVR